MGVSRRKIEAGETPEQSIVREIKEELDADIRVDSHLVDVSYDYDSFHLEMQCFVCELEDSSVTLLEHERRMARFREPLFG